MARRPREPLGEMIYYPIKPSTIDKLREDGWGLLSHAPGMPWLSALCSTGLPPGFISANSQELFYPKHSNSPGSREPAKSVLLSSEIAMKTYFSSDDYKWGFSFLEKCQVCKSWSQWWWLRASRQSLQNSLDLSMWLPMATPVPKEKLPRCSDRRADREVRDEETNFPFRKHNERPKR